MSVVGLGTDIVDIERFEAMSDTALERLARRILTPAELTVFDSHKQQARFLAKRFAVKEAAAKSLGTGIADGVSFQHFEVTTLESGQPQLELTERAFYLARLKGMLHVHVSIADEKHYATATVILSA